MNTRLRSLVRSILAAVPEGQPGLSMPAIIAQMGALDPSAASPDIEAAVQWNFKQGNVTFEFSHEHEVDLWHLTTRGRKA